MADYKKSLSGWLWEESMDLAEEALTTYFIQGIKNGNLDPECYGGFMVQDIKYLAVQRDRYAELAAKSQGDLKTFFEEQRKDYGSATDVTKKKWHVSSESDITLGEAMQGYLDTYDDVMKNMESIYFAVANFPCERLWWWLANQIKDKLRHDVYKKSWVTPNAEWDGGERTANIIDKHQSEMDKDKALDIFRKCMQHEIALFRSVTA